MSKKILSIITTALILLGSMPVAASNNKVTFNRLGGANRYETAVKVSKEGWKTSKYVVVASGEGFADALCSVPLAKKYDAPILLTSKENIDVNTLNRIKELGTENIIIVGGQGVISDKVEKSIKSIKGIKSIERVWGKNRYETSEAIANRLGSKNEVVLTVGDSYADALSIAPIAAVKSMPIMLTKKDSLTVKQYVAKNKVNKFYILGGKSIISDKVEKQLPNSERIYGADRFETNAKIIKRFSNEINFEKIYLALGKGPRNNEFADALSGSALAAKTRSALILTYNGIDKNLKEVVQNNMLSNSKIIALGGEKVVSNSIVSEIANTNIKNIDVKEDSNTNNRSTSSGGGGGSSSSNYKEITAKGVKVNIKGDKVEIYVDKESDMDYANIVIYSGDNIKYIDETRELKNGKYVFKTVLDKGNFNIKINGKIISNINIK